jgi:glc operon protein GlcG
MNTFKSIGHADAQRVIELGLLEASRDGLKPVIIAVSDALGDLLAFARMDGIAPRVVQITIGKAYTAVRMGEQTQDFDERCKKDGRALSDYLDPKLTYLMGGSPIRDKATGNVIGGVGVGGRGAFKGAPGEVGRHEDQALAEKLAEAAAEFAKE